MIIPAENMQPLLYEIEDIEIIPVHKVEEVFERALKKDVIPEQLLSTLQTTKVKRNCSFTSETIF